MRQAPYLRRYARALTGDQAVGDRLVQGVMQAATVGAPLEGELPLRLALFRALHRAWVGACAAPDAPEPILGADRRLQTLSPKHRAILLLVAMEGLLPREAAQVVELDEAELGRSLNEAQSELDGQLVTDVLIVEDEPIIALDLTRLVRELGHAVVGVAATRDEAVAMARETRPGLVLADIRLADGSSGMDAASEILRSLDIPVIFITAFPEHLLTGARPEPAFLITKPFREDAVKTLIGQALFFHTPRSAGAEGASAV